jgi:SAM-dependent methyltransferase
MTAAYSAEFYRDLDQTSGPSAARVLPLVLSLLPVRSAVDVGCGDGSWLAALSALGVTDIMGVEGPWISPQQLKIPTDKVRRMRLDQAIRVNRRFDLALSLEVAEHLPPARAESFVADLVLLAPCVLLSAAIPGQGGHHHVNEQWPEYWAALFAQHDYAAVDCLRLPLWKDGNVAWWYRQNLMLFCDAATCAAYPALAAAAASSPGAVKALVHPECFTQQRRYAEPSFGRWLKMGRAAWSRSRAKKLARS